jgi:Mg2+-importing ATPase
MFASGFQSPLDTAVKNYREIAMDDYTKVDEIPFDFERKRASVVVRHHTSLQLITKGAPEEVLKICSTYGADNHLMTTTTHRKIVAEYNALSEEGFRVLAVAVKHLHKHVR